jgi:hypothetical protein
LRENPRLGYSPAVDAKIGKSKVRGKPPRTQAAKLYGKTTAPCTQRRKVSKENTACNANP